MILREEQENQDPVRLGVIGCGGFGLFALQQFAQAPGVVPVAMAGTHREAARAAAARFGIEVIEEVATLVARPDVDLVYIATPPFLHYPQAMQALRAGKHVICEKPLALDLAQADEMLALAREKNLLLATNLMQRYNPLYEIVKALIKSGALGTVLHGSFENYASDENLPENHWFWDRPKSGGIFVEHGVHFFDLFAGWLGKSTVVSAHRSLRPGTNVEDQVQCTLRYADDVLVTFYHGFHQPGRLDRQELRLVFERGDIRLEEWIPSRLHMHAIADETNTRVICEILPRAVLDATALYGGQERRCRGRGKDIDVYQQFDLHWGESRQKLQVYCELLRAIMRDQIAWIEDRTHQRIVVEENGRESLALACSADRLAQAPIN
jgi:predicted dehydrogenase